MLNLNKIKNNIKHKVVAILTLETLNGSLKINSSNIGNNNEIFKILNGLKIISFWEGIKLKYFKGVDITRKKIVSAAIRIKKDNHTNLKKEKMDLISNCFPKSGSFRNEIKSLKPIIHKWKSDNNKIYNTNIKKCN